MRPKVERQDNTGVPRKCSKCHWRITFNKNGMCTQCSIATLQFRDFGPI